MSRDNPWFKFWPADWRADAALRSCSLGARGLWIEMLSIMHDGTPYGHLTVNGRPVTVPQLAALTGTLPDQLPDLLGELEAAGVFSTNSKGVIYSRRMTRDAKKAGTARRNGRAGGNPSLCNEKLNPASDNPKVKPPDNPGVKTQRPDARSHIPNKPPSSALRSDDPPDPELAGLELDLEAMNAAPIGGVAAGLARVAALEESSPAQQHFAKSMRRGRAPKCPLPGDWQLPEEWRGHALAWGVAEGAVDRLAQRFSAHWRGEGAQRADWHAAWQEWCLGHLDRVERKPPAPPAEPADFVSPSEPVLVFVLSRLGTTTYRSWLGKAAVRWEGEALTVVLPTAFIRQHVETNFHQHFPPGTRFVFEGGKP